MTRTGGVRLLAAAALAAGVAGTLPELAPASPRTARAAHHRGQRGHAPALRMRRGARAPRSGHVPAWLLIPGALAPLTTLPSSSPAPVASDPPAGDPAAPPAPATSPATGTPPAVPSCRTALGAREGEWFIQPSGGTPLCAGTVTIEAQNYGSDDHDLWIKDSAGRAQTLTSGVVGPASAGRPGLQSTQLTLAAGTYTLFCSLIAGATPAASHDAAGMHATIVVAG